MALLVCALPAFATGVATGVSEEGVFVSNLLRNGTFKTPPAAPNSELADRIPWWKSGGPGVALRHAGPEVWLDLSGDFVEQTVPVYRPLLDRLIVRGRMRGAFGQVTLIDGTGARARVRVAPEEGEDELAFQLPIARFNAVAGRELEPPLRLRLRSPADGAAGVTSSWTDLKVLVALPSPEPQALRAELVATLDGIFTTWFERGLDRDGPRETGFVCHGFDAVTGERLLTIPGGWLFLWEYLLGALESEPNPEWLARFTAFFDDYLELGVHPDTGLPRLWDCLADQPLDDRVVELAPNLRFLLNVHERGPEPLRARALDAASRMGEAVLARGVLPDGSIAPKYRPFDGAPNTDAPPIRRLNVPAELARLGALTGDERFTDAARRAVAELEFEHHWGGSWDSIDPDFDDTFGTLGEATLRMMAAHPDDPVFARLADSGWEHFQHLWKDALRFGGSVAADQVRCWELLARYARLRPEAEPAIRTLIMEAARAHLVGEQYANGAWGDVTHFEWEPRRDLSVGDLDGTPANLMRGLALINDPALGLRSQRTEALFTAVLRATAEAYRREYGYLETHTERAGANRAWAEVRMSAGLVEMLRHL